MTARAETAAEGRGDDAAAIPPEAWQAARELAAATRAVAASLPFGSDPAGFLAALERLAVDEAGEEPVPEALP